jgi:hypothetical protein
MCGDPVAEGASGRAGEVRHRRGHVRRMPDRRFPRGEQHVDGRRRLAGGRLAPEVFRRELVERQAPAEHLADDRNLPRVTQGRRAREDVVSAGERRFGERAHRHGGSLVAAPG